MQRQLSRIISGVIVSSFASAILLYCFIWLVDGGLSPPVEVIGVAYFLGILSTILLGVPIYLILGHYNYIA